MKAFGESENASPSVVVLLREDKRAGDHKFLAGSCDETETGRVRLPEDLMTRQTKVYDQFPADNGAVTAVRLDCDTQRSFRRGHSLMCR